MAKPHKEEFARKKKGVISLYNEGYTPLQICSEIGCTIGFVNQIIWKRNIVLRKEISDDIVSNIDAELAERAREMLELMNGRNKNSNK